VFADADLEAAAAAAPGAVFDNTGQDCCARSRILVERSAYDRFLELLVEATRAVTVGDPTTDVTMGPLVSAGQRDAVRSFFDGSFPIAYQGTVPAGPGYWFCRVAPVKQAPDRNTIFGPVVAVIPFDDEPRAVALASDSIYGCFAGMDRDSARSLRVARAIQTGVLSIAPAAQCAGAPFGEFKQSGLNELGVAALASYSEVGVSPPPDASRHPARASWTT
jgi:betaine-aldehyde dehydrogenase